MMKVSALLSPSLALLSIVHGATIAQLSYGSYAGVDLPSGVTQFLSVRYANIPRRFSASGPPIQFTGTYISDHYRSGCVGSGDLGNSLEDCLFVEVYAPTAAISVNSTAKLPVYVFVQGGGLTNTFGRFNATGLLQASNMSIIAVAFTYRTGPFGFLASEEVRAGGTLNAGLLDQYQLLQCVRKEIVHFGGDPNHVVLGGQSAGAGCILSHLAANGGINQNLYHAALIQSPSSSPVRTVNEQQFQYDNLVDRVGCSSAIDTLECLRQLPTSQILAASAVRPYPGNVDIPVFGWNIVLDGEYFQEAPFDAFAKGKYVKVPMLVGSVNDEGILFTPNNISTAISAQTFLKNNFPAMTTAQLQTISLLYGFNSTTDVNHNHPYWLKASNAYGEIRYTCPANNIAGYASTWSYRYNIATPQQTSSLQGISHGSDLAAVFAPNYGSPQQRSLLQGDAKSTLQWLQGYWTSFIRTYNPNALRFPGSPEWATWSSQCANVSSCVGQRFLFNETECGTERVPGAQMQRCGYLESIAVELEQ